MSEAIRKVFGKGEDPPEWGDPRREHVLVCRVDFLDIRCLDIAYLASLSHLLPLPNQILAYILTH